MICKYYVSFCNEQNDWEDTGFGSNNIRNATFEARDLQRILSRDKKDSNCYYAVFERVSDCINKLIYSARGY